LGTRIEGERVAAMLGVRPWLGPDALKGRLKSARAPGVVHLATAGMFFPSGVARALKGRWGLLHESGNPWQRSFLALAGVNAWLSEQEPAAGAESGLLAASDVLDLDFLDTELVVLSADETGRGVTSGGGACGLRPAFALAGAKTVVTSLWPVPDEQTTELME